MEHAKATKIVIKEKWIDAEAATFREEHNPKDGDKKFYLDALIVPFDKVSRNGVQYSKESIMRTHQMLVGKNLMHNHVLDGSDTFPRGEWLSTRVENDGLHGRAEVYNTAYNRDYIDWLRSASSPRVSLQVTGAAEQRKAENGSYYQEADIDDWLEASTVNVPGFDMAKASFAKAMAEAFKGTHREDADLLDKGDFGRKAIRQGDGSYKIELAGFTYTASSLDELEQMLKDKGLMKSESAGFFKKLAEVHKRVGPTF